MWTKFLGSDALDVANLGETVDEIDEMFDVVCDDEAIGIQESTDDVERAKEFIDLVPERLEDRLEFGLTEQDASKHKLVGAVRQEVENVGRRRDIYEGIAIQLDQR